MSCSGTSVKEQISSQSVKMPLGASVLLLQAFNHLIMQYILHLYCLLSNPLIAILCRKWNTGTLRNEENTWYLGTLESSKNEFWQKINNHIVKIGNFFSSVITLRKRLIQCSEHQSKSSHPQRTWNVNEFIITCIVCRSITNNESCKIHMDWECAFTSR